MADNPAQVNLFKNMMFDYGSDLTKPPGFSPMPESYVDLPVMFRAPYGPVTTPPPAPPKESGYGLTEQLIKGVPNYLLYGGVAILAYWFAKRR